MKPKRFKVQCCECNAIFNNDYRATHEKNIHNNKRVGIKTIGAPANPFEAALLLKKRKADSELEVTEKESKQKKDDECTDDDDVNLEEDIINSNVTLQLEVEAPGPVTTTSPNVPNKNIAKDDTQNDKPENVCNLKVQKDSDNNLSNWPSLMGNFGDLIDKLGDCKKMFKHYAESEIVNERFSAIEIVNSALLVKNASEAVIEYANLFLAKLNYMQNSVVIDNSNAESVLVNHDPGLRSNLLSENQKQNLINLGPHQPHLANFPADDNNRRFCPSWYKKFEYVEYSTVKDAAFCFVCSIFPEGLGREKKEEAWITLGVKNWSKMKSKGKTVLGKLQQHFSSQSHKAALSDYCNFLLTKGHVDVLLDKTKRLALIEESKLEKQNQNIIEILIDVCKTLRKQGLAFRGDSGSDGNYCQIVKLLSRYNPVLKSWIDDIGLRPYHVTYMSPSSQNELISLVANDIRKSVVDEINEAPFFSVMADTTPDMSHKDIMSIVIRTVNDEGEARERLVKSVECTDKTGQGMAELILTSLNSLNINTSKMAFQSYDYASTMSGKFQGVQKKMTELIGHNVPYVPCQDHRTNTALEHACNKSLLVQELFNYLEQLYVFFTSSTKRFRHLKEKIENIDRAVQLTNLSKTRWTARASAVRAFNQSLEGILELLEEIKKDSTFDSKTRTKAYGLFKKIRGFDFMVTFYLLKNVLEKIKILTETLESPQFNVLDGITVIQGIAKNLHDVSSDEKALNDLIDSASEFSSKLGIDADVDFKKHHRAANIDMKMFYRREFKEVLDTLVMELTDNSSSIKKLFAPISEMFSFPLRKETLTDSNLEQAIAMFPPGSSDDIPDVFSLKSQMEILFDICISEDGGKKQATTLQEVLHQATKMKTCLKQAHKLCIFIITAAYGVSSNERSFSQLKFVKSMLRTTMSDDRLDNLMLLRCEKEICEIVNSKKLTQQWASLKKRRISIK